MNPKRLFFILIMITAVILMAGCGSSQAQSTAPKVVDTSPKAGDVNVDPATTELKITFDKEMNPDSYSIVKDETKGKFPGLVGKPVWSADKKTLTQKITLQPKTNYYLSINSAQFTDFKDSNGTPAVPYLLEFETS